jgi:hypothetical protein
VAEEKMIALAKGNQVTAVQFQGGPPGKTDRNYMMHLYVFPNTTNLAIRLIAEMVFPELWPLGKTVK